MVVYYKMKYYDQNIEEENMLVKSLKNSILLFTVIAFSACAIGPDFQKPQMEVAKTYKAAPDSMKTDSLMDLSWWKLFSDPQLDSLVVTALKNNKSVQIAISRIEESRASYGFTKADILPGINITAGAGRGDYAMGVKMQSITNNFYVAPTLSWEIDFWGKLRRANEAAFAEITSSEYGLRAAQIGLIAQVVGTYFRLLDYKQRLIISKNTLKSRQDGLEIMNKRFKYGIIPEIDVNQAQIQMEIAAASVPVNDRLLKKTENSLNILLGRVPMEIEVDENLENRKIPPEIPIGLPAQLLERRPDILQAEYTLKAQNARIGVAKGKMLPSISLTGALGLASNDLTAITSGSPAWSIGGSLLGPLFNFGKYRSAVDVEKARTQQALYNYQYTVLVAFKEVEDALVEIETYKREQKSVNNRYLAAKNAAKLSWARYDKGATSYLEVLENERSLFSAELDLSRLKQEYLNAYVKLYKALGGGWLSDGERTQANSNNGQ
jgi:multidrug efflux system outer membrane protein